MKRCMYEDVERECLGPCMYQYIHVCGISDEQKPCNDAVREVCDAYEPVKEGV